MAQRTGVQHYFVERDSGFVPALQSLALSYKYLRHWSRVLAAHLPGP